MRLLRDNRAATVWEYAVAMLIGLIAVGAVTLLARRIRSEFMAAESSLNWR